MKATKRPNLPQLPPGFEYRLDLARAAPSRELKSAPRHRWFYFPHSYSHRLVHHILDYWAIPRGGRLADSFVGSGTTLLAARERGMSSVGFDLSPLAVTVANTKVARFDPEILQQGLHRILSGARREELEVPERLSKAFTKQELQEISGLMKVIRGLHPPARNFFLVALISTARTFSRAVPDGGWFRWGEWPDRSGEVRPAFEARAADMIADAQTLDWPEDAPPAEAYLGDARKLPLRSASVDGFITSPPYANRHDYSRVFHIDLLLLGLTEPEVTRLRYKSIRSHVEARRPDGYNHHLNGYRVPERLQIALSTLPADADPRVEPLLKGYFEDIYLSLREVGRALRQDGRAAYVVGNVRYAGVMVPVDEIVAELAPQAGLSFESAWVIRLRGNSAQQMGEYGRQPARESVVLMRKEG